MEVYSFDTQEVEIKLYAIESALEALFFAVNGLRNINAIDDLELSGFEYILRDARAKATELARGMQPLWLQDSGRIVLLIGEEKSPVLNNQKVLE